MMKRLHPDDIFHWGCKAHRQQGCVEGIAAPGQFFGRGINRQSPGCDLDLVDLDGVKGLIARAHLPVTVGKFHRLSSGFKNAPGWRALALTHPRPATASRPGPITQKK